jgi:hypothetical protein
MRCGKAALFLSVVFVLSLLPWMVDNWPTQDGPSHLAAAHIFMRYGDPQTPYARYLTLEGGGLRPSTLYYGALSLLGGDGGLRSAEKWLVSLTIAALPLSVALFVGRLVPTRTDMAFLVLPLVTGWALAMGFVPFLLALSCSYCALALGWAGPGGEENRIRPLQTTAASIAFLLCALLHPVVAVFTGVAFLLLYGPRLQHTRTWVRIGLVTVPTATWVTAAYFAAQTVAPPSTRQTQWPRVGALLPGFIEYHLAYSVWELVPRGAVLVLLFLLSARTVRNEGMRSTSATGAVARVAAVFIAAYLCAPKVLADWYYCSARFLVFATFLLPALVDVPARYRSRVPVLGAALTLGVVACDLPQLSRLSRQVQDVLDAGVDVPAGGRVIPIDFADRHWGMIDKPQPLAHAWSLLVVAHDVVGSQLPAAGKPRMGGERFRMLSFRPGMLGTATGLLPWSSPEGDYDAARACQGLDREACWRALEPRKNNLDTVRDRYDYVLMVSPSPLIRDILGEGLTLRRHVGVAWLYETGTRG